MPTGSVQAVADLAVPIMNDLAGTSDNAAFVTMIYKNVVNQAPDAVSLATYRGVLDRGEMTQSEMLTAVTTLGVNETAINLVGMSHSGVGFL